MMSSPLRVFVVAEVYLFVHCLAAALFVLNRAPHSEAAWAGLPLDDAWIHLAYARSFSGVTDFAFVPGQLDPGFSSPLWALLVSALSFALHDARDLVLGAKIAGVVVGLAASLIAHGLAYQVSRRTSAAWVAGILVAVDPDLSFAQVSGMEVLLAGALMLGAMLAWTHERPGIVGACLGLAVLTRPECILLAFAAGTASHLVRDANSRWHAGWVVAPPLAASLCWSAFCVAQTGRWFPNPWYVKHRAGSPYHALRDAWRIVWPWLLETPWFFAGIGAVAIAFACRLVLFRSDSRKTLARDWLLVGFPLVFLLGAAWAHEITDARSFYLRRYWLPILPWICVLLGIGSVAVIDAARSARKWRRAAIVAATGVLVVPPAVLVPRFIEQSTLYAWNCQNIEEMQVVAAEWIRQRTTPDQWVAAHDVGALRVLSERPVLDLVGLQDHRMPSQFEELSRLTRPRYTVVFPSWFPRMVRSWDNRVVHRIQSPRYTICTGCDQDVMVILERRSDSP